MTTPPGSPHTPLSPHSPQSSGLSPHSLVGAPPRPITDSFPWMSPSSLHLKPITQDDLHKIVFPPDETFDIVDGMLVWIPMSVGTVTHSDLRSLHWELFLGGDVYRAMIGVTHGTTLPTRTKAGGMRVTDILITRRSSPTSSEENPSPPVPRIETFIVRSARKPAHAITEFTSANFVDDIVSKWAEYYIANVPYYYLFHLNDLENNGSACLSLGSLTYFHGAVPSPTGDTADVASSSSTTSHDMYYKKVFRDDDIVDIGPYADFGYSVAQLMSVSFLSDAVEERAMIRFGEFRRLRRFRKRKILAEKHKLMSEREETNTKYLEAYSALNDTFEELIELLKPRDHIEDNIKMEEINNASAELQKLRAEQIQVYENLKAEITKQDQKLAELDHALALVETQFPADTSHHSSPSRADAPAESIP